VTTLADYAPIVGEEVVGQLHRLAEHLQGRRFVHINSTAVGGGWLRFCPGPFPC
jgi:trehalose synthase